MSETRETTRTTATLSQRLRGAMVGGGYLALAGVLAALGQSGGSTLALGALITISEPVSSLTVEALGPWPSVILGVCVNAFALGYVAHSLALFGARMDGAADFAARILNRNNG